MDFLVPRVGPCQVGTQALRPDPSNNPNPVPWRVVFLDA